MCGKQVWPQNNSRLPSSKMPWSFEASSCVMNHDEKALIGHENK